MVSIWQAEVVGQDMDIVGIGELWVMVAETAGLRELRIAKKTPKSLQATVRFAVEHSYHSQLQPSRERSWIWIPKAPRAMFTGSLPRLRWILELNGSVAIASTLLEVEPERNLQRVPAGEPRSWAPFGGC